MSWWRARIAGGIAAGVIALYLSGAAAQECEIKDCAECPAMVVVPAGRMLRSDKFAGADFPVVRLLGE